MTFIQKTIRFFSAQAAKARMPMIKFRKGATIETGHGTAVSGAAPSSKSKSSGRPVQQTTVLSELPTRFRRQTISQEEIDYINRGGPA